MLFDDIDNEFTLSVAKELLLLNKLKNHASLLNYFESTLYQQGFAIEQGAMTERDKISHSEIEFTFTPLLQKHLRLTGSDWDGSWPKFRVIQAKAFACEFIESLEKINLYVVKCSKDSVYYDDVADVEAALISDMKGGGEHDETGWNGISLKP